MSKFSCWRRWTNNTTTWPVGLLVFKIPSQRDNVCIVYACIEQLSEHFYILRDNVSLTIASQCRYGTNVDPFRYFCCFFANICQRYLHFLYFYKSYFITQKNESNLRRESRLSIFNSRLFVIKIFNLKMCNSIQTEQTKWNENFCVSFYVILHLYRKLIENLTVNHELS